MGIINDLMGVLPLIKKISEKKKPYSEEEKTELKNLILELNKLVLIVQYGPHLNEDCFYLRFNNIGEEKDYQQYSKHALFERHVCFNPSFPNKKIRAIFQRPFFSDKIFHQFTFMSESLGAGEKTPVGCVMIMDGSEDFSLDFKYYPNKFKTFRDFYRELVELKEAIETTGKIRFK